MSVAEEIAAMVAADQAERWAGLNHVWQLARLWVADRRRLRRIRRIVQVERLQTADELFGAALLLQHGRSLADFRMARTLAQRAAELQHPRARRLAALAEDRYLLRSGQPQRYGTQFACTTGRGWHLEPVDPNVSDAEREAAGVEPLAAMQRRIERLNIATRGRCGVSRPVLDAIRTVMEDSAARSDQTE